eukprot:scaffold7275_cov61-Phaeocystis_antarctica.AAC.2
MADFSELLSKLIDDIGRHQVGRVGCTLLVVAVVEHYEILCLVPSLGLRTRLPPKYVVLLAASGPTDSADGLSLGGACSAHPNGAVPLGTLQCPPFAHRSGKLLFSYTGDKTANRW